MGIEKIPGTKLTPFVCWFVESRQHQHFRRARMGWYALKLLIMEHIIDKDIATMKARVGWSEEDEAKLEECMKAQVMENQVIQEDSSRLEPKLNASRALFFQSYVEAWSF